MIDKLYILFYTIKYYLQGDTWTEDDQYDLTNDMAKMIVGGFKK